jgi:hypothetical protein
MDMNTLNAIGLGLGLIVGIGIGGLVYVRRGYAGDNYCNIKDSKGCSHKEIIDRTDLKRHWLCDKLIVTCPGSEGWWVSEFTRYANCACYEMKYHRESREYILSVTSVRPIRLTLKDSNDSIVLVDRP